MAFPLIVAVVSLIFAVLVFRQYQERHKAHQLLWTIALCQSVAASSAYIPALGGSALGFKIYYIFGALLVAAWLGLGSIHLMWPGKAAKAALWGVVLFSLWGTVAILQAPINEAALADLQGGPGTGVLEGKGWLIPLIVMNIFGTVAVVAPALISAWRLITNQGAAALAQGNLLIGVGLLIIAFAGTVARLLPSWAGAFWSTMAVGWVVAFLGFLAIASSEQEKKRGAEA